MVWSDKTTRFAGLISAKGGPQGGDGGSAEVSSANALGYAGRVDLSAPGGTMGTLLLDPDNITIASSGSAASPSVAFGDAPSPQTISAASLGTTLGTSNVTLQANNDIEFSASVTGATVTSGNGNLILQAGRSILFDSNVALTLQGGLSATYNDAGASTSGRAAGVATFTMGPGSSITAPGGVSIAAGTFGGADPSSYAPNIGSITLGAVTTLGAAIRADNSASNAGQITVNGALDSSGSGTNASGGAIVLTAAAGLTLNSTVNASGTGTGNGGAVTLTAGAGTWTANAAGDTITSNSSGSGNGGTITLSAAGGALTADGAISSTSASGNGNGGAVSVAVTGSVYALTVSDITTDAYGGNAGSVTLAATGLLTAAMINARSDPGSGYIASGGDGGAVSLTSHNAGISAGAISTYTNNWSTNYYMGGGNVTLNAQGGALTVGAIDTTALVTQGGAVQLTAGNGAISASTISTGGGTFGGTVNLTASGGIGTGAIDTTGNSSSSGGAVTLHANGGNLVTGSITTYGEDVTLTSSGAVTAGAIDTTSQVGNGGNVSVTAAANLTTGAIDTTGQDGNGGNVTLTITNAGTTASTLTISQISTGAAWSLEPQSGAITIENNSTVAGSGIAVNGALNASGTAGPDVNGGNITVAGPGPITFGQAITANGAGSGAGGTINLSAQGNLTLANDLTAQNSVTLAAYGGTLTTQSISTGNNAISLEGASFAFNGAALNSGSAATVITVDGAATVGGTGTISQAALNTVTAGTLGISALGAASDLTVIGASFGESLVNLTAGRQLSLTGNLTAPGSTVALAAGGMISETAYVGIAAATLTGSSNGAATLIGGNNTIENLGPFSTGNGGFALTDSVATLGLTGAISTGTGAFTLTNIGGGISQLSGTITAGTLTGSSFGAASFAQTGNSIGTLGAFSTSNGGLSLADGTALFLAGPVNTGTGTLALVDPSTVTQTAGTSRPAG